ncbi:hypothetical protein GDO81_018477 [Engystomops pustulosus]|uniref:Uncharacterized protein n=1 Tax=Engystomops pustulosus TaxID=76066 RepID=A0AAV6ZU70_ENGPU|nr:hypothetical protein GDO81_018477 [Engystomops pustulosus]
MTNMDPGDGMEMLCDTNMCYVELNGMTGLGWRVSLLGPLHTSEWVASNSRHTHSMCMSNAKQPVQFWLSALEPDVPVQL